MPGIQSRSAPVEEVDLVARIDDDDEALRLRGLVRREVLHPL